MADRQINQPGGLMPSWANDALMVDPPEVWDGTPTKVEPGAGKRDIGYLPEENPDAQELNHKLNELGRWVQYFSAIQPMNWFDAGAPVDASASQIVSGSAMCSDEGSQRWYVFGNVVTVAGECAFSGDGYTWQELTGFPAGIVFDFAASKPPGDTPTHTGPFVMASDATPNAALVVAEILTGGITTYAVPSTGTCAIEHHAWDSFNERWIYVGDNNNATVPAIWTQAVSAALVLRGATAVNSTTGFLVAVNSSGLSVVIGDGAAPNIDVWTSVDAITFTRATPTGLTAGETPQSILWDELRQVFVLMTHDETFTSTNGIAWTKISGVLAGVGSFQRRCFANDGGGLYIAAAGDTFGAKIRFSQDGGVTWRTIPVPPSEAPGGGGTALPITQVSYSRTHGRFMALWGKQAGAVDSNVALSLAAGTTVQEIEQISIPKVT